MAGKIGIFITATLMGAIFVGCGGSGGEGTATTGTQLTGNAAVRAAAVASYQGLGAGMGYPVQVLDAAAPSGSKVPLGLGQSLRSILQVSKATRTTFGNLTFISELNLYVGAPTQSGNVFTLNFYTDSAGTQSAGTVAITIPGGTTDFPSYPVTVPFTVNVNGGNIACTGTGSFVFKDATGANSLTGNFTLTKTGVIEKLNLSLDDSFNVTGSITLLESNATINATNVNGFVGGDIPCSISVTPTGLTGTGTLNLITGAVSLNVKGSAGTSTAAVNSSGQLVLNYADGTTETISSPATSTLTTSTTTTTTTTGSTTSTGTTPAYKTPVLIVNGGSTYTLTNTQYALDAKGDIAVVQPSNNYFYNYYSAANPSSPTQLQSAGGFFGPVCINASGVMTSIDGFYWTSPTAAPTAFNTFGTGLDSAVGSMYVSDAGVFVSGTGDIDQFTHIATPFAPVAYWISTTSPVQQLAEPPNVTAVTSVYESPGGVIAGEATINSVNSILVWANTTATPSNLALPSSTYAANYLLASDNGNIVASGYNPGQNVAPLFWTNATSTSSYLPTLSPGSEDTVYALAINASGVIVGSDFVISNTTNNYQHAVRWVNQKVQDLNSLIPANSGWVLTSANMINKQGEIVGVGTYNGSTAVYMLQPAS